MDWDAIRRLKKSVDKQTDDLIARRVSEDPDFCATCINQGEVQEEDGSMVACPTCTAKRREEKRRRR